MVRHFEFVRKSAEHMRQVTLAPRSQAQSNMATSKLNLQHNRCQVTVSKKTSKKIFGIIVHEPRPEKMFFVASPMGLWCQIKVYGLYFTNLLVAIHVTCADARNLTISEGGWVGAF